MTWRGVAAALALALAACPSGKRGPEISDSVVAESSGPPHVRVMEREHEAPVSCDSVTGLWERLQCAFKTDVSTCTWLEVDTPALAAHPFASDFSACRSLRGTGPRIALNDRPGVAHALEVSPLGDRIADVRGPMATVFYLVDGVVVGQLPFSWPRPWADVEPLENVLGQVLPPADEPTAERIIEWSLRTGGEARLERALEAPIVDWLDRWNDVYQRLSPPLQARARDALSQRLHDEEDPPSLTLLADLEAYPELQPKDFVELLAAAAEAAAELHGDWYEVRPVLDALVAHGDVRGGELSCRIYGMQVLSGLPAEHDAYEEVDTTAQDQALAVLAHTKAACPWVAVALDTAPCSADLRCNVDGGLPKAEGDDEEVDDDSEVPLPQRPLCSPAVAGRTLEEDSAEPLHPGPMLLAAGQQRGAISKELLLRNARRLYRYQYPPLPAVPDGGEDAEDVGGDEPPCRRPRDLPEAVCRLPVTATELSFGGCRLRIDDKAKVVRVEELIAQ